MEFLRRKSLKNMLLRNMKIQKYKVPVAEAIQTCSTVICNDCYGSRDNDSKLSCVIFISSHIAKTIFLCQKKSGVLLTCELHFQWKKESNIWLRKYYFCNHLHSKPWEYQNVADTFQC